MLDQEVYGFGTKVYNTQTYTFLRILKAGSGPSFPGLYCTPLTGSGVDFYLTGNLVLQNFGTLF